MIAAGYCTYGSCSTLVLTTGQGVNGYTLDTEIGEFILTHPDVSASAHCAKIARFSKS